MSSTSSSGYSAITSSQFWKTTNASSTRLTVRRMFLTQGWPFICSGSTVIRSSVFIFPKHVQSLPRLVQPIAINACSYAIVVMCSYSRHWVNEYTGLFYKAQRDLDLRRISRRKMVVGQYSNSITALFLSKRIKTGCAGCIGYVLVDRAIVPNYTDY